MKKRLSIIIVLIVILLLSVIVFKAVNKNKIIEDYTNVVVQKEKLEVYQEYKLSDVVKIKNAQITNDRVINTKKLGKEKLEIFYKEEKTQKKAYLEIEVVDTKAPLILGANYFTINEGDNKNLENFFLLADNYTKKPIAKIEGEYDYNKVGTYKLKIVLEDESKNKTEKDFSLRVRSKSESVKTPLKRAKVLYEDVIKEHKNSKTKIGIDVSKWQGEIDFDKLKSAKVEFMMIRVGTQKDFEKDSRIDEYFKRNIEEAKRVGIPVGVYYFTYASSIKEAKEQAQWLKKQIAKYEIEYPVVFDWESFKYFNNLNLSLYDLNQIVRAFYDELGNEYNPMHYSSKYYLEHVWELDYPVWLAHYTKKTDYKGEYRMWQLADTGRVAGIRGDVDINVEYLSK